MNIALQAHDVASLSPLLILLGAAVVLLLVESLWESIAKRISGSIAFTALLLALLAAFFAPASEHPLLTPWLQFDALSRFFTIFFLLIGMASVLLASSFFQRFEASRGEYYFLLLASIIGLILIVAAADFLTLFLGLETLSIALYVLCSYMKKWQLSNEAALKYFLIGALATSFLLYGIALLYGAMGSTQFADLLLAKNSLMGTERMMFLTGIAFVTLGLCFKAAIVPFHVWAPDVYDGAPTPVTGFMAVGTKVGAFAAFARLFLVYLPQFDLFWNEVMAILAIFTMIYANFVALRQSQLRRFFAYSGIAHAGYLLIPIIVVTPDSLYALTFYLIIYSLATLGAFAVLGILDENDKGAVLDDVSGLFFRSPILGGMFALCLLTLAGIPPTAGFFAKFYLFKVAFQGGYFVLVIVGLLATVLSAYYYLRIIALLFLEGSRGNANTEKLWPAVLVGGVACVAILLLSFFPEPIMQLFDLALN